MEEDVNKKDVTGIPILDKIFFQANLNRYGISALLLIAVGCMGGAAVGTGGLEKTFQLAVLAVTTMFSLSMMLAIAPMKWVILSSVVAIICDIIFIAINLLS